MATLRVNAVAFRRLIEENGWSERELAIHMGVAYSYVNRVLSGKRQPGAKFIAGALMLGLTMEDAFIVDPAPKS
jgi:transcriptional regulator with XRE-family HTH domain